tara:strand:+ start:295 stop:1029 length:735 start_codon:yes stop_codon:yes gene_type:complete
MTNSSIRSIIEKFPKKRPPLPNKIKKIFDKLYLKNRHSFLSQLSERWLHYIIKDRNSNKRTLEIGAGTLNHLEYENLDKVYDIIEPKKFLFKNNLNKKFINKIYKNLKKCKNLYYERIISCAVLEHHTNLPEFLYLSSIKMNKKGYQSHSVPCEGYPTWDLTWFLINGIIFKIKYGYSFKHIMRHEHVNNLDEITDLIKFFYKNVRIKYSYPFFNKYLSFYANIEFDEPNNKNIKKYLKIRSKK